MVHHSYSRFSTEGNIPKCPCPQGDCLYRERIKNWQVSREKHNKNSHEVKADVHFPMSDDVGWLGVVVCSTSGTWPRAGTYCPVSPVYLEDISLPCCILISSLPLLCLQPSWICPVSTRSQAHGWEPPLYHVLMCLQKISPSKRSSGAWRGTPALPPSSRGTTLVTTSCSLNSEAESASQSTTQGMPHSSFRALKCLTVDTTLVKSSGGLEITA